MQLYEKYRPKTFDEFVGQEKVKKQIKLLMNRPGWNRDALWFEGPSGTGKTSLAGIIANQLAETNWALFQYSGSSCSKDLLKDIHYSIRLSALKGKWKVYAVDEAHAMTKSAVQGWLTLLEQLPKYRLIIFTTTESLKNSVFGDFSEPFARRCKVFRFTNDEKLTQAFAKRAKEIAGAESLDSRPLEAYIEMVRDCNNNMGAVLQRVEMGEMLI